MPSTRSDKVSIVLQLASVFVEACECSFGGLVSSQNYVPEHVTSVCFPEQAAPERDSRFLIRREQEGAAPSRHPPGINNLKKTRLFRRPIPSWTLRLLASQRLSRGSSLTRDSLRRHESKWCSAVHP